MNSFRYIIKSLTHYFRLNLSVILGIALSTAILLGAFIIGDSVQHNLKKITLERLGKTDFVLTVGERLFRSELSDDLNRNGLETTSVLHATGMAILNGGEARTNQVKVWGIDHQFNQFAGTDSLFNLQKNELAVNQHLANILGVNPGDELLIRVNKLSTFPSNTPFVSAEETSVSFRAKVKAIASPVQTGNFNLQNIQSSPKNIFISKDWLNNQLELDNKANVILVTSENKDEAELMNQLQQCWKLEDINLKIRKDEQLDFSEVISERVFIEPAIENILISKIPESQPVFTYFANRFTLRDKSTPYSFISGLSAGSAPMKEDQIIINEWLANDLKATVGDTIITEYFVVGPLRKLDEKQNQFVVKEIVNLEGKYSDQLLMPEIPGMSDAGHCRDWETGVPIELGSIRPKDEDYWNTYKGTPKAFVKLETAKKLWGNRFGEVTAVRLKSMDTLVIEKQILSKLTPSSIGFQLTAAKRDGLKAAGGGVDFGQLFIGLSFFVLLASLLLAYLMFRLYLNYRRDEIYTLQSIGFHKKKIRKLVFTESFFIIATGMIIGLPLGIVYNNLILKAINTIWFEIVQTSMVETHITSAAIVKSIVTIGFISIIASGLMLKKFTSEKRKKTKEANKHLRWNLISGIVLLIGAILIFMTQLNNKGKIDPSLFFAAGFLLMPALIFLLNSYFIFRNRSTRVIHNYRQLVLNRIYTNRRKVILIISFLSVGIFLVLSTGLNRKDLTSNADQPNSGTGGFTYFAESSFPILVDLNSEEGRYEFGLDNTDFEFTQFRALTGDDASCLNLNKISKPRILGFNPDAFNNKEAFSFVTHSEELDPKHPWLSLKKPLDSEVIPAIADQTVIQWGLGMSVGDTLVYKHEQGEDVSLKLIGGLANSIFQGNILIDENLFIQHFPSVSGSQVFLVSGKENPETLKSAMRNYGLELEPAKDRLLKFYQVENTYLNIYLQLGALGLLIGTIGLGIVIFRSLMEQRSELAVLQATGYSKRKIFKLIFTEHILMVVLAVLTGTIPAIISALPSLSSNLYKGLIYWALALIFIIISSASLWIYFAGRSSLNKSLNEAIRND